MLGRRAGSGSAHLSQPACRHLTCWMRVLRPSTSWRGFLPLRLWEAQEAGPEAAGSP